eukprot:1157524-Pelagomonas_calceolata.AAC.3
MEHACSHRNMQGVFHVTKRDEWPHRIGRLCWRRGGMAMVLMDIITLLHDKCHVSNVRLDTGEVNKEKIDTEKESAASAPARRTRVSFADGADSDDEGGAGKDAGGPKKSRLERIAEAQVRLCQGCVDCGLVWWKMPMHK